MFRLFARIPPIATFLLVGALLFALDNWRNSQTAEENHIQITANTIEQLARSLEQRYGQQPSSHELEKELQAYIDEELLYREALKFELHQSDEVVRRRLAQTMAFIIEGKADFETPTEQQLQAWHAQNQPGSESLTRIDFQHIFFSFDSNTNRGNSEILASQLLEKLGSEKTYPVDSGDPFLLGVQFRAQSLVKLANNFGEQFANQISAIEPGHWAGPISSNYGHHLVWIERREKANTLGYEQQRDQLIHAWRIHRRREVLAQALDQLRLEFDIEIDRSTAIRVSQQ